jgi:hypothetical protein
MFCLHSSSQNTRTKAFWKHHLPLTFREASREKWWTPRSCTLEGFSYAFFYFSSPCQGNGLSPALREVAGKCRREGHGSASLWVALWGWVARSAQYVLPPQLGANENRQATSKSQHLSFLPFPHSFPASFYKESSPRVSNLPSPNSHVAQEQPWIAAQAGSSPDPDQLAWFCRADGRRLHLPGKTKQQQ